MSDPTMSTILGWVTEQKKSLLPLQLRQDIVRIALAIHDVDMLLGNHIRKLYGSQFPVEGCTKDQKDYFKNQVELDPLLSNYFLKEIADYAKRRDTAIMLWVGGIFGAKGTRRTYVTHQGEIEYTAQTRENDFQNAEKYARTNETARTGVEAAVVVELLVKKIPTISLKRVKPNPSSPILKYVRDKNKDEISALDLMIEYPDFTIKQNASVPSTEVFMKTFDKISQFGKEDVSEKTLINSLLDTGRFDEYSAKNHITMAMTNGILFERRAGFYAKV